MKISCFSCDPLVYGDVTEINKLNSVLGFNVGLDANPLNEVKLVAEKINEDLDIIEECVPEISANTRTGGNQYINFGDFVIQMYNAFKEDITHK